jgi:hypothetical protein
MLAARAGRKLFPCLFGSLPSDRLSCWQHVWFIQLTPFRAGLRPQFSDVTGGRKAIPDLKYRLGCPDRFRCLQDSRALRRSFFAWGMKHRHSGLRLLSPAVVCNGLAPAAIEQRRAVLDGAYPALQSAFVRKRPSPSVLPLRPEPAELLSVHPDPPVPCFSPPRASILTATEQAPVCRRIIKMKRALTMTFAVVAIVATAFGADNTLGSWKYNTAKSTTPTGVSPITSLTVTREATGDGVKVTAKGERKDGSKIDTTTIAKYDGKEVPVKGSGLAWDTVSIKQSGDNALTEERTR